MRIFVPSAGHVPRMHVFKWIPHDFDVTCVVDGKEQMRDVKKVFPWLRVVVSGMSSLVETRNFIAEELLKKNEWYVGMDDDIEKLEIVDSKIWHREHVNVTEEKPPVPHKTWRQAFRIPIVPKNSMAFFDHLRNVTEKNETIYSGVATMENPFFRQRKWGYSRFTKSYVHVGKNTREIPWHGKYGHDSCRTTQVLLRYGKVVVCNWVYGVQKAYGEGGIGSSTKRRPILNKHLNSIVQHAPGLVGIGRGANTALRILRYNEESIEKWKADHPNWKSQQQKHLKETYK